jgi:hypothetical protein
MRANNLTISIPNKGCEKNCPYCVSKCTGAIKEDRGLMPQGADHGTAGTGLFRNADWEGWALSKFQRCTFILWAFPGIPLGNTNQWDLLAGHGMNVIAISVDDSGSVPIEKLSRIIHDSGMLLRMTFNVTNGLKNGMLTSWLFGRLLLRIIQRRRNELNGSRKMLIRLCINVSWVN